MSYSDIKNGRERESYRENMKSLSLLVFSAMPHLITTMRHLCFPMMSHYMFCAFSKFHRFVFKSEHVGNGFKRHLAVHDVQSPV